jgi:hypothetical protein
MLAGEHWSSPKAICAHMGFKKALKIIKERMNWLRSFAFGNLRHG